MCSLNTGLCESALEYSDMVGYRGFSQKAPL